MTLDGKKITVPARSAACCSSRARSSPDVGAGQVASVRALGKSVAEAREVRVLHRTRAFLGFAKRYPYGSRAHATSRRLARALAMSASAVMTSLSQRSITDARILQEEIRAIWRRTGKTIL